MQSGQAELWPHSKSARRVIRSVHPMHSIGFIREEKEALLGDFSASQRGRMQVTALILQVYICNSTV